MKTLLTMAICILGYAGAAQQQAEITREIESIEFITSDTTVTFKFHYTINAGPLGQIDGRKSSRPVKLPEDLDALSTQEKNYLIGLRDLLNSLQ